MHEERRTRFVLKRSGGASEIAFYNSPEEFRIVHIIQCGCCVLGQLVLYKSEPAMPRCRVIKQEAHTNILEEWMRDTSTGIDGKNDVDNLSKGYESCVQDGFSDLFVQPALNYKEKKK